MTRLYFDSVIKAMWMASEFEVRFEDEDGNKLGWGSCDNSEITWYIADQNNQISGEYRGGIFYVAKESESIFNPKEGDYVRRNDFKAFYEIGINYKNNEEAKIEIVMRDNKQFFSPQKEESV